MSRYFGKRHQIMMRRKVPEDPEVLARLVPGVEWCKTQYFERHHHRYLIMKRRIRGYWIGGQWWVDPLSYHWENWTNDPILR